MSLHQQHLSQLKFCPRCGGSMMLKLLKQGEPQRLVCQNCMYVFYLDPKVAACALFKIDGKIPLLRRGIEPSYGKWVFPGGFVDRGERVEDAAIREAREEANLEVRIVSLLNVYSYAGSPIVLIVYACEVVGGEFKASDECLEARLFDPSEIPWDDLAFESTRDALKEYVERYC